MKEVNKDERKNTFSLAALQESPFRENLDSWDNLLHFKKKNQIFYYRRVSSHSMLNLNTKRGNSINQLSSLPWTVNKDLTLLRIGPFTDGMNWLKKKMKEKLNHLILFLFPKLKFLLVRLFCTLTVTSIFFPLFSLHWVNRLRLPPSLFLNKVHSWTPTLILLPPLLLQFLWSYLLNSNSYSLTSWTPTLLLGDMLTLVTYQSVARSPSGSDPLFLSIPLFVSYSWWNCKYSLWLRQIDLGFHYYRTLSEFELLYLKVLNESKDINAGQLS